MDADFWHRKWARNEIGFHQNDASPGLVAHFNELYLEPWGRVFVPLCGKTLDIHWLLSNGCRVVGAELSRVAVEQLFDELGATPNIERVGKVHRYSATNIDIFVGDIFDVSNAELGPVDAIYDRAALVAFPENLRPRYAAHLMCISNKVPQLLLCYEYDQTSMEGPPFSVDADEVNRHYGGSYRPTLLSSDPVRGGLKGNHAAKENVWLLRNG